MNGGRAYGLEPIPGREWDSLLGTVRGYVQPIPTQRAPNGYVRIPVSAARAEAVRQYVLSNPTGHRYALTGPNCVTFVQGALDEADVRNPLNGFGFGVTPNAQLTGLSRMSGTSQP